MTRRLPEPSGFLGWHLQPLPSPQVSKTEISLAQGCWKILLVLTELWR